MLTPLLLSALSTLGFYESAKAVGKSLSGGGDNNQKKKIEPLNGPSSSNSGSSSTTSGTTQNQSNSGSSNSNNSSSSSSSSSGSSSGSSSSSSSKSGSSTALSSTMLPETSDIAQIYEVLAPMAGNYMNAQAEQIGQAQRSMGTLAGRTMGNSQTAGLGNYTYNRLMRPQADTMRDEILVKGYTTQLNQLLSNALSNAQKRYNNKASGGGTTDQGNSTGVTKINGSGTKSVSQGTTMHKLPNSYEVEDKNGKWYRVNRTTETDDQWVQMYESAKSKAAKEGRGFNG